MKYGNKFEFKFDFQKVNNTVFRSNVGRAQKKHIIFLHILVFIANCNQSFIVLPSVSKKLTLLNSLPNNNCETFSGNSRMYEWLKVTSIIKKKKKKKKNRKKSGGGGKKKNTRKKEKKKSKSKSKSKKLFMLG